MNDPYEDEAVWYVVRKANGSMYTSNNTLARARRAAEDKRFFVARWDIQACQWVKAPEPPATVNVVLTVEWAEWAAAERGPQRGHMSSIAEACQQALDAMRTT